MNSRKQLALLIVAAAATTTLGAFPQEPDPQTAPSEMIGMVCEMWNTPDGQIHYVILGHVPAEEAANTVEWISVGD